MSIAAGCTALSSVTRPNVGRLPHCLGNNPTFFSYFARLRERRALPKESQAVPWGLLVARIARGPDILRIAVR
jgi:hypothetical protein